MRQASTQRAGEAPAAGRYRTAARTTDCALRYLTRFKTRAVGGILRVTGKPSRKNSLKYSRNSNVNVKRKPEQKKKKKAKHADIKCWYLTPNSQKPEVAGTANITNRTSESYKTYVSLLEIKYPKQNIIDLTKRKGRPPKAGNVSSRDMKI